MERAPGRPFQPLERLLFGPPSPRKRSQHRTPNVTVLRLRNQFGENLLGSRFFPETPYTCPRAAFLHTVIAVLRYRLPKPSMASGYIDFLLVGQPSLGARGKGRFSPQWRPSDVRAEVVDG